MITPVSMETMSPSFSTRLADGIPWTTSSFTEVQSTQGYPRYPLNAGFAPNSFIFSAAAISRSCVEAPGFTNFRTCSKISRTTCPLFRIFSISCGVLITIAIAPDLAPHPPHGFDNGGGHLLNGLLAIHLAEATERTVMLNYGSRLRMFSPQRF